MLTHEFSKVTPSWHFGTLGEKKNVGLNLSAIFVMEILVENIFLFQMDGKTADGGPGGFLSTY